MKRKGDLNIPYEKGFLIEAEKFVKYKDALLRLLGASEIELVTRGILDIDCGIDAVAKIDNQAYFISLRFRETNLDYNSFTLSGSLTGYKSELSKWINSRVRPDFFIQITESNLGTRYIEVNVSAFNIYIDSLIKNNELDTKYNSKLNAYEFSLKGHSNLDYGIRNYFKEK